MEKLSLGLIEVIGLTAAIEAADVACKAADVELVGYERAKGQGMLTVKVLGQVGAVTAAVQAAQAAAAGVNKVISVRVIARPDPQIEALIRSSQNVPPGGRATTAAESSAGVEPEDAPAGKPEPKAKAKPSPEPKDQPEAQPKE